MELTRPELQVLSSILRDLIHYNQQEQTHYKKCATDLYEKCNPEDVLTYGRYVSMNHMKDEAREYKRKKIKLAKIQTKLKKMLG